METITERYLEASRAALKDFSSSQLFLAWADAALRDGSLEAETILYEVMRKNIKG